MCTPACTWEVGVAQSGVSAQGGMSAQTPPLPEMVTVAVGTHPTGMHTCLKINFYAQNVLFRSCHVTLL